jgi:hypothetical protein
MLRQTFTTQIPITLVKGKDKNGSPLMRMRGCASTPSLDSDGEYLDPKGYDYDYFLKHGFMNWNHQTNVDPLSIIGKPTSARVTKNNEFDIEFDLFPESEKAMQIFTLQKILEGQGMALGLSIEGKVLERDPKNNKIVTKAKITGCAITPNPKNQDTTASIIKSENFNKLSAYDDSSEDEREKALSAGGNGGVLALESLEGDTKKLNYSKKTLTKSQAFEKIFRDLSWITINGAQNLYNLTEKIQKSLVMENTNETIETTPVISEEAITKALEVLGINKVEVAEKVADTEPKEIDILKARIAEIEKGEDTEPIVATVEPVKETPVVVEEVAVEEVVVKAESPDILKGITDLFKGEISGMKSSFDQKFQAMGELTKGLMDQNDELLARIEKVEKEPIVRKSITTQAFVDRNFDGDRIEKGNSKQLSISNHKREICDTLTKSITGENDVITNPKLGGDIMLFEQAGTVTKGLVAAAKELGINLVK